MKYCVAVTDNEWYRFLAAQLPDEVNFWRPGGGTRVRALQPGAPFLFKLHAPLNSIAGGGFFVSHSTLPLSLAWKAFGPKNGASTFDDLRRLIMRARQRHRKDIAGIDVDPWIGCTILNEPFFFPESEWIPAPRDWSPNIVSVKTYESETGAGREVWERVSNLLVKREPPADKQPTRAILEDGERYGSAYLTRARLGQGTFQVLVRDAYQRRCAITGERTLPVLEAAHIKPYAKSGPHRVSNGLLLRSDLHTLFDLGYLTIDKELRVEVSRRIREEYENGRLYYALRGKSLEIVPTAHADRPSADFIEWHNSEVFVP
jgi:putative restriction endonuclease